MTYKTLLSAPSLEPVTLEVAKWHLVVDHDEDDLLIYNAIKAARQHIEARCNRAIVRQKWRIYRDGGLGAMKLQPAMVREVEQVQYIDTAGATQTLASSVYTFDVPRQELYLAYGQSWPSARAIASSVWADVWAGEYTVASPVDILAEIPEDIKTAILMMVEDLYEHRGRQSEISLYGNRAFDALIRPYVTYEIG